MTWFSSKSCPSSDRLPSGAGVAASCCVAGAGPCATEKLPSDDSEAHDHVLLGVGEEEVLMRLLTVPSSSSSLVALARFIAR